MISKARMRFLDLVKIRVLDRKLCSSCLSQIMEYDCRLDHQIGKDISISNEQFFPFWLDRMTKFPRPAMGLDAFDRWADLLAR